MTQKPDIERLTIALADLMALGDYALKVLQHLRETDDPATRAEVEAPHFLATLQGCLQVAHRAHHPPSDGGPTQEEILSVGLDRAEAQGEFSHLLRTHIARTLPTLRLAGPWMLMPPREDRRWRRYQQGSDRLVASIYPYSASMPWVGIVDGQPPREFPDVDAAKLAIDAALIDEGWVLCHKLQPTEAQQ